MIPVLSAVITFIWGAGFTALMGYNFEPLILVVPFLIAARTISHSIQFRERFFEELERCGDKEKAAIESRRRSDDARQRLHRHRRHRPDRSLGRAHADPYQASDRRQLLGAQQPGDRGAFGSDPVLLFSNAAPAAARRRRSLARSPAASMGRFCVHPSGRMVVVAGFAVVIVWSAYWYQFLTVGDSRPGSPLLWPDSEYNQSVRHINDKFQGTDHLYVIVEGQAESMIAVAAGTRRIEAFQRHMLRSPHVG